MATQTKTWQNKILSAAAADQYAGLFWYIEISAPGRRVFPAAHPGVHIPVVAVAPDPEQTRHWAHLLAELFKVNNPPGWEFAAQLTSLEALRETGCSWYRFGEIDIVCPSCGAVGWESCSCGPLIRRVDDGES